MDCAKLKEILEQHKLWAGDASKGAKANLRGANLRGADLDFSCWPLCCGSLEAKTDDRINKQLLYHVISVIGTDFFSEEQIAFANGLPCVGELERLVK